ncbi:hypothetical protein GGTG_08385, partial [Gaeumannomyces tritici R3-111a-1]
WVDRIPAPCRAQNARATSSNRLSLRTAHSVAHAHAAPRPVVAIFGSCARRRPCCYCCPSPSGCAMGPKRGDSLVWVGPSNCRRLCHPQDVAGVILNLAAGLRRNMQEDAKGVGRRGVDGPWLVNLALQSRPVKQPPR